MKVHITLPAKEKPLASGGCPAPARIGDFNELKNYEIMFKIFIDRIN
jgi:hypothetical protein